MEFRILGPLEVVADGRRLELGGGRQRALLALLLLHANEVVSSDRLIDELWGERPPPTAPKALQNLVSQLRRSLGSDGDAVIVTRAPGYLLRVEPDAIDARRFERVVEEGGRLLASGDPKGAADLLREGLGLWRGGVLAEFAYERFAEAEVGRIEELRLRGLEECLEADLALGRHANLVGELERLVAEHPLRERLRGQLMLALYRSGRQAEALQAYQDGRRLLAEELGLEPGGSLQRLEKQILNQDPVLEPPPLVPLPAEERGRVLPGEVRPRRRLALLAGAVVLTVAAFSVFLVTRADESRPTVVPDSLVRIDPETNEITGVYRVGRDPIYLAAVGDWVFATNLSDRTLSRVDVRSGDVRTIGGLGSLYGLSGAPDGTLWIGSDDAAQLTQLNPPTLAVLRRIRLPGQPTAFVAVGAGSLWTSQGFPTIFGPSSVLRVGLRSGSIARRFSIPPVSVAFELAFGEGAAWVGVGIKHVLVRIDAATGAIDSVPIVPYPSNPAVGFDNVWIASTEGDRLYRVDPLTTEVRDIIPVGDTPTAVAAGAGAVWVANESSGTVSRVDPRKNEVVATIHTGYHPHGVAVAGGAVWVAISAKVFSSGGPTLVPAD